MEEVRDVTEAFEAELVAFHAMVVDQVHAPTGSVQGRADLITAQRIYRTLATGHGVAVGGEAQSA